MDVFNHRISLNEAAEIVQGALRHGSMVGARSAIFHHLGMMQQRITALHDSFPRNTLHAVAVKSCALALD
jgi:hypothetical protein